MTAIHVRAPGRVNLIGDHTDYTGGLCLPMAIDRWTEIVGESVDGRVELASTNEPGTVEFATPLAVDPGGLQPSWGRYVAAVAEQLGTVVGLRGTVTTTIPVGAGLSSSAALEVAAALALGCTGTPLEIATLCREAELRATGVPTGILDQLSSAAGVAGHALILDCHELTVTPTPVPDGLDVVVMFVAHRTLVGSEYADRVAECAAAEALIGPLRVATLRDVDSIDDPLLRRRARHVVSENERVRAFAAALALGDARLAGEIMVDGHNSLSRDFATSTAQMDAAVTSVAATPGVYGARMTGGGFGGCLVALTEPGALTHGWVVSAVGGAERLS